jgi:hypothetical protein
MYFALEGVSPENQDFFWALKLLKWQRAKLMYIK